MAFNVNLYDCDNVRKRFVFEIYFEFIWNDGYCSKLKPIQKQKFHFSTTQQSTDYNYKPYDIVWAIEKIWSFILKNDYLKCFAL